MGYNHTKPSSLSVKEIKLWYKIQQGWTCETYAKWKNLVTKDQKLHDSFVLNVQNRQIYRDGE